MMPRSDVAGQRADQGPAARQDDARVASVLAETLSYARERDYRGWDYGDGASSQLLSVVPGERSSLHGAVRGIVDRAPVNLRPLLLVEPQRTFEAAALFAMANQTAGWLREYSPAALDAPEEGYDVATEALLEWLVDERTEGYSGFCGSHPYGRRHTGGDAGSAEEPDIASTSHATRALLRGRYRSPRYSAAATSAASFVIEDLTSSRLGSGAAVAVHPDQDDHSDDVLPVDASALGARVLLDVHDHTRQNQLLSAARSILDYVEDRQTTRGGWHGRTPPSPSTRSMDTVQNGLVIEAFQRYAEVTGDDRYELTLADAVEFYQRVLFDDDGAPNADEQRSYPRDVRAAAQGILVFTYRGDIEFARRIVEWTLDNLYAGDGRFLFRQHRLHTKRPVLMRWSVAWMAYALSEYLRCRYVD